MKVLRIKETLTVAEKEQEIQFLIKELKGVRQLGKSSYICFDDYNEKLDLTCFSNIDKIMEGVPPFALASRNIKDEDTILSFDNERIGNGEKPFIIAGPCAIESYDQMAKIAEHLCKLGVQFMRGGAYKPRTSPYAFQGLKENGLEIFSKIKHEFGLKVVTEVMSIDKIDEVADVSDILQVGSRNMFHYALLRELGKSHKPILLKRGMSAKMEEFLLAAEYILSGGNNQVILCERGINTFETATRNTLDLSVVPYVKQNSHLPIIVDPSHGTGIRSFVEPMSLAALACGADGLEIEIHNDPDNALCDGPQSLTLEQFSQLIKKIDLL